MLWLRPGDGAARAELGGKLRFPRPLARREMLKAAPGHVIGSSQAVAGAGCQELVAARESHKDM